LSRGSRHRRVLHSFPTRRSSDLRGLTRCSLIVGSGHSWFRAILVPELRVRYPCHVLIIGTCNNRTAQTVTNGLIVFNKSSPVNRSEEHTSELQSRENLVCRLLLE